MMRVLINRGRVCKFLSLHVDVTVFFNFSFDVRVDQGVERMDTEALASKLIQPHLKIFVFKNGR